MFKGRTYDYRGVHRRDRRRPFGRRRLDEMLYDIARSQGAFLVLCYLEQHGPSTLYELWQNLKFSREAIRHAVSVLMIAGLCSKERMESFPFAWEIRLTPSGEEFLGTRVRDLPGFPWRRQEVSVTRTEPEEFRHRAPAVKVAR